MTLYGLMRRLWILVLPHALRRALWKLAPPWVQMLRGRITRRLESRARHDEIYDAEYFDRIVEPAMAMSCETMARTILEELEPKTVVDVGCGTGRLLASLRSPGVQVLGLEHARAAISICRARGIEVEPFDIENDPVRNWNADVAVSTEVAEHLPPACADRFVRLLTSIADTIVLTAAVPGSGGTDHVNEQPNEYWIDRLKRHGYDFDRARSMRWRRRWQGAGVAGCFARTVMVFQRVAPPAPEGSSSSDRTPALAGAS
ncbi:MAG: class I SAM-dependent methyltransferase [Planctomycetota bacterium]|nr:class I SAM-dependent methyltransferase [Planctomycetota bacterium]